MKHIEDLRYMLCEELDKIAKKGELTAGSLETIDKLAHSIKSIDTIMAMEEYSEDGSYEGGRSYERNSSYARGGNRGGGGNRGRNSRDSYRNGNSRRSYDGYSGNEEIKDELNELLEEASDERERMAIKKVMELLK